MVVSGENVGAWSTNGSKSGVETIEVNGGYRITSRIRQDLEIPIYK